MAPVPLEHVPTPLGQVPKADKLPPEAFAEPLGHYADIGLLPPAIYERGPRDKRIDAYQMTLDGANYASQFLKGPEKAKYLEERLDALSKFSQDVAPSRRPRTAAIGACTLRPSLGREAPSRPPTCAKPGAMTATRPWRLTCSMAQIRAITCPQPDSGA